jgi:mannose-6-phosphate isomerase-like protein (cupin superfamily)
MSTQQDSNQPGGVRIIDTRPGALSDGTVLDNIEGAEYGAGVSLILEDTDVDGSGPALHQHPYAETFGIHAGRALFTVAGTQVVGEAGMVLVVQPGRLLAPGHAHIVQRLSHGPGSVARADHSRVGTQLAILAFFRAGWAARQHVG